MGVTVTNLIQGPAELYHAPFGTAEPANNAAAWGVGWVDLGGTQDGVNVAVELTYTELTVDQVIDVPGQTLTKRVASIATNLAEATLANWARVLNEAVQTGTFEPTVDGTEAQPLYAAIGVQGIGPGGDPRRIIVRRALQIENVESSYKKDGQTLLPTRWAAHWVSKSIAPFAVIDE